MGKEPMVLHFERLKCLLEGTVQSRSDKDRQYHPRIILQANILDTCDGSIMRDSVCVHLKALLECLTKEELIEWVIESQAIPPPIAPEE